MPIIVFLFKHFRDTSPICCTSSEHLKKMTGRHKAQEGSSGCNGPQGAFAAESITSSAERRLHKVLKKTKSEGTVKFLGVVMGPTEGHG